MHLVKHENIAENRVIPEDLANKYSGIKNLLPNSL